jgi:hypothetical protein
MTTYKIPKHPCFKDFGIFKTINGTYISPGWIKVEPNTTRANVSFSDEVLSYTKKEVSVRQDVPKKDQLIKVLSSNGKTEYYVKFQHGSWSCNCPAATFRKGNCKHIKLIQINNKL